MLARLHSAIHESRACVMYGVPSPASKIRYLLTPGTIKYLGVVPNRDYPNKRSESIAALVRVIKPFGGIL